MKDLRIEDIPVPKVGDKEVLIKVMACGVCGTDVHIYDGDKGAADCPVGTVLGHEFSGVIERVGKDVAHLKKGDRVCIDPNKLCGECYYCRSGIGHFCEKMIGIGTTVNGGFSQYCVVPKSQVNKISDTTTFEQAAMSEPLSCCLHGIDMCEIKPGSTVMVIGAGMIGLLMVQLARLKGAAKVIVSEPVEIKRAQAKSLGADFCIDPVNEDVKAVLGKNEIDRIEIIIECVGNPSTIEQALDLAGKKSTVMLFGLTKPNAEIRVKPYSLFQKEITIKSSFINPYTMDRAVRLINAKKVDVSSMVAETASIDKLPQILADPKLHTKGKYIISAWK